jgi:hypothetical protein
MFQRGMLGTLGSVALGSVFGGRHSQAVAAAPSPVPVASGALPLAPMPLAPMQMLLQQNMNQQNMQQIQQMQQQMQQPHNMQNMQQHMQQLQQRQIVQLQLLMGVVPLPPPPAATKATKADKRAATKRKHADEWTTFEGKPMQRKTQYQLVWRRNTKARQQAKQAAEQAAEQAAAAAAEQAAADAKAEALAEAAAAQVHAEQQMFLSQPRAPSTRDRAPTRTHEEDDVRHAEDSNFWWMSRGQKPKRLVRGALVDIDFEGPDLSSHEKPKISLQQLFEECRIEGEATAAAAAKAAKAAGTAAAIKASSQAAAAAATPAATPPAPPPAPPPPISAAAAAKERWQALLTYLDEHESEAAFHDMEQAGIDYLRWEEQEKACAAGGSYMAVAGADGIHTIGFKRAKGTSFLPSFLLPSFLPSLTHSSLTRLAHSQVGWIRR